MSKVFISYSHKDREFVDRLLDDLSRNGVETWVDRSEIKVGNHIPYRISEGIAESEFILVIFSENFLRSEWCKQEVSSAITKELDRGQRVVLPVKIEECEIPGILKPKRYAQFTGWKEESGRYHSAFQDLLVSIKPNLDSDATRRARVELTIEKEPSDFDEETKRKLVDAISKLLEIAPNAVLIVSIEKGQSVKVIIELPTESAERLLTAYARKQARLFEYIPDLVFVNLSGAESETVTKDYPIEKKWALLIGIHNYYGTGFRPLGYAVSDVSAICETLAESSYERDQIRLMTDESTSVDLRPTRNNILREISRISRCAGSGDTILIYFSGHGVEHGGESYLVPADAMDEILAVTAIPLETLMHILELSQARHKIVIVDSCHSGSWFRKKRDHCMTQGFLKSLAVKAEGWAILISCQPGEVSWEWEEQGHGVFAYYLTEALKGKADYDGDGTISVSEAAQYVITKVKEWAEDRNKEQNVTLSTTTKDDSDIELVRLAKKEFEILNPAPSDFTSYSHIEQEVDSVLEIHMVPFRSTAEVPKIYQHQRNMNYHLRFYFPKPGVEAKKLDCLIVMLNGLGEATPTIYDDFGLEFAKNGIPSVLFPLTNHFCRRKDSKADGSDIFSPGDKLDSISATQEMVIETARYPEGIIHTYLQMMSDVNRFVDITRNPDVHPGFYQFYRRHFVEDTRICLLGYALGGILTLALLLKDPEKYHSVYLLESGANFSDINYGALFVRSEAMAKMMWRRYVVDAVATGRKNIEHVRDYLVFQHDREEMKSAWGEVVRKVHSGESVSNIEEDPLFFQRFVRRTEEAEAMWDGVVLDINQRFKLISMPQKERDIFEKIAIGNYKSLYKEDLSKLCNKILIFLGGTDAVFTAEAIQSFAPEKTGLAIMQIPGLGHWLKFSSREQWLMWKEFITKTIINFSEIGPSM